MRKITIAAAAVAALKVGAAVGQSCTIIPISFEAGGGAVSGYVLDGRPLCYFIDRTDVRGEARLIAENACFTPEGRADCTSAYAFDSGDTGFRFFVQQDRLRAQHEYFTLQVSLF